MFLKKHESIQEYEDSCFFFPTSFSLLPPHVYTHAEDRDSKKRKTD